MSIVVPMTVQTNEQEVPMVLSGYKGKDGFSPVVTVEDITGGHRVTITDAEGDHVFDVMDGRGADEIYDTVSNMNVANVPDAANGNVSALVLKVNPVQSGSGDPSPQNIRPISGRSSVVLKQGGKNLMCGVINHPVAVYSQGDPDTDCIITSSAGTSLIVACKAGITYTLSGIADRNRGYVGFFETYPEVNSIGEKVTVSNGTTDGYRFTAPKDGYCACYVMNAEVSTATAQIEIGTTATAYEAPNLSNHTASIPTPPGTLYGGEIDWIQQKLKVTMGIIDLGSLTWTTVGTSRFYPSNITNFKRAITTDERAQGLICSIFKFSSSKAFNDEMDDNSMLRGTDGLGVDLQIKCTQYAGDADAFKTAVNGAYLCYELATPIEYDLSSLDIISLAKGENNLWIDNGSVKLMTYPCDTKLYIDKKVSQ